MSRARTGAALALAGAALASAAAPSALGASRTVTIDGWSARTMAFSGPRLLWTEAATVRVDPRRIAGSPAGALRFDYYRAEVFRVRLDRASARFAGDPEAAVSVRESIAAMTPGVLAPTGDGGFVTAPGATRFAAPVIHCCSDEGLETVIDSDGRAGAAATVAAAWTGSRVRFVQLAPATAGAVPTQLVREVDPTGATAPSATTTGDPGTPGLVGATADAVGWVDPAAPTALVLHRDGAAPVAVALPGPALRLWSAPGLFAVAVRAGSGVALLRVDEAAAPRAVRVWNGAGLPRVALGGGSVAVADGHRVLASRRGALRRVTTSPRVVDAIGVDGRRLAWVERATRKGARVGVVRLARLR